MVEHHLEHEAVTDGVAFGVGFAVDEAGGVGPVDAEDFVDVTGEIVAGDLDPDVGFGDEVSGDVFGKGELAEDVGADAAPFFAGDFVDVFEFGGGAVEGGGGEGVADEVAAFIEAEGGDAGEAGAVLVWDGEPVVFEAFEGGGGAAVIGVELDDEFATGFFEAGLMGAMGAAMGLADVADGDAAFALPLFDEFLGAIGGAVIDNEPFEVAAGLGIEAEVGAMQGVLAIEGRGEDGEGDRGARRHGVSGRLGWT